MPSSRCTATDCLVHLLIIGFYYYCLFDSFEVLRCFESLRTFRTLIYAMIENTVPPNLWYQMDCGKSSFLNTFVAKRRKDQL